MSMKRLKFLKSKHQIVRLDMFIWDRSANSSSTGRPSSLNIFSPTIQGRILKLSYKIHDDPAMLHGSAQVRKNILSESSNVDLVSSVRLHTWPSVAQSWISRGRNYSWPSNAIVSEVQRDGCDVVNVSHRDYKHDSIQWRYSFSRVEVILIRSWTQNQQLVYHMLRYFTKRIIIREWKDDDKMVCTYHIKTLMLWACERKSPVWWESNCVIVICSKLLGTLMK